MRLRQQSGDPGGAPVFGLESLTCPQCGKPMSPRMRVCPFCHHGQGLVAERFAAARLRRQLAWALRLVVAVLILGGLGAWVYFNPAQAGRLCTQARERISGWAGRSETSRQQTPGGGQNRQSPDGGSNRQLPGGATSEHRPPAVAPARETLVSVPYRAVCPTCRGEGYYLRSARDREDCPVCRGRGSFMRPIPPGRKVCPNCNAIGRTEDQRTATHVASGSRKRAHDCGRCNGAGYVKK